MIFTCNSFFNYFIKYSFLYMYINIIFLCILKGKSTSIMKKLKLMLINVIGVQQDVHLNREEKKFNNNT